MQPLTKANVDAFCRVCLQEFDASGKNDYKFLPGRCGIFEKTNENLDKLLRVIVCGAGDNYVLRQQRGILPRLLCGTCHMKACTFYEFRERARCSAIVLCEMLQEHLRDSMIRNLQKFCRTCLKQLKAADSSSTDGGAPHVDDPEISDWLAECVDLNVAKESGGGDNDRYPKHLCNWCYKKLRRFIEFRRLAKESLEYLENLLGGLEAEEVVLVVAKQEPTEQEDSKKEILMLKESTSSEEDEKPEMACDVFAEQLPEFQANNAKGNTDPATYEKHNFEQDSDFNWDTDSNNNDDDNDADDRKNTENNEISNNEDDDDVNANDDSADESDDDDDDVPINVMAQRVAARRKRAQRKPTVKTETATPSSNPTEADCTTGKRKPKVKAKKTNKKVKNSESSVQNEKDSTAKKSIVCEKCQKKFYKQILYDAHVRGEHEGVAQPFQCEDCPRAYRAYPFLKRHIKDEHTEPAQKYPHKCVVCCRMFKRLDHLRTHIRGVHEGIRPYKCQYCEKSFGARKTVRVHEMTHTDVRPFQCEHCPMAFRQICDLRRHTERHTTRPELLCPVCKRAKATVEELQAHIAEHDSTRHQCPTCGRVFKKRSHLRDHENAVHLGLRPHKCGYCERTFACRKSMLDHERLHTNERPKVCPHCGDTFRQGSVLRAHVRRRHERQGEPAKQRKRKADKAPPQPETDMSELLVLAQSALI